MAKAEKLIAGGNQPNLFRWLYVQVDSLIDNDAFDSFDISDLQASGLDGWDVVAVIPKTFGERLTNLSTSGNTWGGGLGGIVLGAYLILKKTVSDLKDPQTQMDA